jgi:hypothetical protein
MHRTDTGFKLHVYGRTNNGKGQFYEIIIDFDLFWIPYLVKDFKRILTEKITYLKTLINLFNNE